MISTKGRYALRFLADLAATSDGNFIPLKGIAEREGISIKYLERIAFSLTQNDILESSHGKGGGYRLKGKAEDCTVYSILSMMEDGIEPVACLRCGAEPCGREDHCPTISMWREYDRMTKEYFSSLTIADLAKGIRF